MASYDNSNINPSLLDPTMACFIHASSTDTPGIDDMDTGHPLPAIYNDDDDNPPAPGIASLAMAPTPLHRLTTISQALKRDLKLSPKSEAKLDLYCNVSITFMLDQ